MYVGYPEVNSAGEKHVVFYDSDWEFYEAVSTRVDGTPTRVNFDNGTLEIMTLSIEHERFREAIGEMVADVSKWFRVPVARGGSTTLKLRSRERGLEADQCFWVANEAIVRGLRRLDLTAHPAPDLVVEVDITHAVVDRESIYASLGIPEMWHFDRKTLLTGWELVDGVWSRIERSRSFPMIRVADLNPFLERLERDGHTHVMIEFNDWLRTLPR